MRLYAAPYEPPLLSLPPRDGIEPRPDVAGASIGLVVGRHRFVATCAAAPQFGCVALPRCRPGWHRMAELDPGLAFRDDRTTVTRPGASRTLSDDLETLEWRMGEGPPGSVQ